MKSKILRVRKIEIPIISIETILLTANNCAGKKATKSVLDNLARFKKLYAKNEDEGLTAKEYRTIKEVIRYFSIRGKKYKNFKSF